ncbi:P-loop containing nucleoside triphosphate hydrolase protein [Xylaria arbuscula]|nr:P-loop containing nucleoside triphosphate hydrolase protein [Xylaria arbuscula]
MDSRLQCSQAHSELSSIFQERRNLDLLSGCAGKEGETSETDVENTASSKEVGHGGAIACRYNIPDWFRCRAMATFDAISMKQINLRIVDKARQDVENCREGSDMNNTVSSTEPKGQTNYFEIDGDAYSKLQDIVAAACVLDNRGQLPASGTSILLRYSSNDGLAVCDEVLHYLAREMRASLVSLDLEDMQDLVEEFDDQDKIRRKTDAEVSSEDEPNRNDEFGLFKHYFAVRSKRKETKEATERYNQVLTSLLDSLYVEKSGRLAEADDLSPSNQSMLLLYVRDTVGILNVEWRRPRFFARIWEAVAERRSKGNHIVLICAVDETSSSYRFEKKIRIGKANDVDLPSCLSNMEYNMTPDSGVGVRNAQRLKRMLRKRIGYAFSKEDLDPRAEWLQKGMAPQSMSEALWEEDDLQCVVMHIAARYWRHSRVLNLDDIRDVLIQMGLLNDPSDKATVIHENNDQSINSDVDGNENGCNDKDEIEDLDLEALPILDSPAEQEWREQKAVQNESNAALDKIMDMIGMEPIKRHFMEIKNLVDTSRRQEVDLTDEFFGCLFVGKPGTGKTVIAALYTQFLSLLKVIPRKKLKTTTGTQLSKGGVRKCKEVIEDLLKSWHSSDHSSDSSSDSSDNNGGVVVVDQAHQLLDSEDAVLEFLIGEIDRLRGKVVFIFTGYPKLMETFLGHTPGLQSRIRFNIKFEDFEDGELHRIFAQLLQKKFKGKMRLEGGINGLYARIVVRRIGRARTKTSFGNAREVHNSLINILSRQATRIAVSRLRNEQEDDLFLTKTDLIGLPPSTTLENSKAWISLREMIGLASVKESVQALTDLLQINYQRELAELPPVSVSLNKLFLGNPGTGKTTVAKYYGQILAEVGLLSNGEVMMKTPTDFKGKYLGESEILTKAILESAQGRVLIIDEAYSLADLSDGNSYRTAVIDTIVAEVQGTASEDRCVLLLGYKDKMEELFSVNPGLGRRFPVSSAFDFQDYSKEEMRQILNMKLAELGFTASASAKEIAMKVLDKTRNHRNYGNTGEVDILLDRAKIQQRKRLSSLNDEGDAHLKFEPQDFDPDFDRTDRSETSIRQVFADFVGAEALIDKFEGYQRIARNAEALGIDPRSQIPFTFLFRGPPGTGKTTTARRMGEVFYHLGFLATQDVVSCSGTDLIGEYIGRTGPKTQKVFQKALGKVLFVDEAYHLSDNEFGWEAVSEMMNILTKEEYRNKIIVILAGYREDINRLISINPGFGSRFSEVLDFKHLAVEKCTELLVRCLHGYKLDMSSINKLTGIKLFEPIQDLAALPGWGNARDIQTIARSVFGLILKSKTQPPSLVVTDEIIESEVNQMLRERRERAKDVQDSSRPRPFVFHQHNLSTV